MRVVLDTSVVFNIVVQTQPVAGLMVKPDLVQLAFAPTLLRSEIANTLRTQVRFGQPGHNETIGLCHDGIALMDEFVPAHKPAIPAVKYQHPADDMLFVALAQRFGCTLLTVDNELTAIARKIDATLVRN